MPTKINWALARADYEIHGLSQNAVARKYGVSATSVADHRKKEGWQKRDPDDPPREALSTADAVTQAFDGQTVDMSDDQRIRYQQRIDELEAQLAVARHEAETYKPTVDVDLYTTQDEVRQFFGEEALREVAYEALGEINKERTKRGMPFIDYETNPAMVERELDRITKELIDRRTRFANESTLRVVKMRHVNGHIVQVPVEHQLNNEAGQQGAALWKMRDKGAKLVMPYLCQRHNCWQEAVVQGGSFTYDGYCSPQHRATDPYLDQQVTPGVSRSAGAPYLSRTTAAQASGL